MAKAKAAKSKPAVNITEGNWVATRQKADDLQAALRLDLTSAIDEGVNKSISSARKRAQEIRKLMGEIRSMLQATKVARKEAK